MKKSISGTTFVAFPLLPKTTQLKIYGCIAIVSLAGCTSTQVRWDATNIRKEVMVYYNDQIMDNLIRAKNKLPFVHVDITLLTSQGASQISGTIGSGETRTHTDSGPIGALNMFSKMVTRPFAFSMTPQQTESLTISAAPALGSQTLASPTPKPENEPESTPMPTPDVLSKVTEVFGPDEEVITRTEEKTLKPTPTPKSITIYELYEDFCKRGHLSDRPIRPRDGTFVPGTLKKWGTHYYYIDIAWQHRKAYYDFCKQLFTKGQAGSLEKAFQQSLAAPLAVPPR